LESISFLITGTSLVRAGLMVYAMAPSTISAAAVRMGGRPPGHLGRPAPGYRNGLRPRRDQADL
jgi:hypothetical protein